MSFWIIALIVVAVYLIVIPFLAPLVLASRADDMIEAAERPRTVMMDPEGEINAYVSPEREARSSLSKGV